MSDSIIVVGNGESVLESEAGNIIAANNILQALIRELRAQSNKHINSDDVESLINIIYQLKNLL